MATFLGVTILDEVLNPSWVIGADPCISVPGAYQNTVTYGQALIDGITAVNAAAADYGTYGVDAVEENLWGLLTAIEAFNAPLEQWFEARWMLLANTNSWLPFDGWTDTPESCGMTVNELYTAAVVMENWATALNNAYNSLYATMAALQAYEEQEVEEEIVEQTINNAINENNKTLLENAEAAQRYNILQTLYSIQSLVLPALIIVVGYILYKRSK